MDDGHPAFPFRDSDAECEAATDSVGLDDACVSRHSGGMVAWWARVAWLADSRLERLTSPMISPSIVRAPRIFADGEWRLESTVQSWRCRGDFCAQQTHSPRARHLFLKAFSVAKSSGQVSKWRLLGLRPSSPVLRAYRTAHSNRAASRAQRTTMCFPRREARSSCSARA